MPGHPAARGLSVRAGVGVAEMQVADRLAVVIGRTVVCESPDPPRAGVMGIRATVCPTLLLLAGGSVGSGILLVSMNAGASYGSPIRYFSARC